MRLVREGKSEVKGREEGEGDESIGIVSLSGEDEVDQVQRLRRRLEMVEESELPMNQ